MFLTKFIQRRSLNSSQTCSLPLPLSFPISVTGFTIYPGAQVKTPGVTLLSAHFITTSYKCHLQNMSQILLLLSVSTDHYDLSSQLQLHSLAAGLPVSTIKYSPSLPIFLFHLLHCIQAIFKYKSGMCAPLLKKFQWLFVKVRMQFKLSWAFQTLHTQSPSQFLK